MSALLEKLRESKEAAQAAANRAYHRVVRALANDDDKGLELDDVNEVLEAAAVSTDTLTRDVARRREYDRLQAELKAVRDMHAEQPGLIAKIDAAKSELKLAEQHYVDTVHPWELRLQTIRHNAPMIADIERRLRDLEFHPPEES